MNKKILITVILILSLSAGFIENSSAWDNERTHKNLSKRATEHSTLDKNSGDFLSKLGFKGGLLEEFQNNNIQRTVSDWIQEGADLEDAGNPLQGLVGQARYNNHFHNPLKGWDNAGLDGRKTKRKTKGTGYFKVTKSNG